MSSTNRSNARDSHISDYYRTPTEDITKFLIEYSHVCTKYSPLIFDPCAGGDEKNPMSYPEAIKGLQLLSNQNFNPFHNPTIETLDIREDSLAKYKGDYLLFDTEKELGKKPDIIISNPPFNVALEFVQKAINEIDDNGMVIMLLRLNFFGSKKRFSFFQNNGPEYCFVHSKRMCFTDDGSTDSIEYAHFVWRKHGFVFTNTKVI